MVRLTASSKKNLKKILKHTILYVLVPSETLKFAKVKKYSES